MSSAQLNNERQQPLHIVHVGQKEETDNRLKVLDAITESHHEHKRLFLTNFMVDHPFLIHIGVLAIGIVVAIIHFGDREMLLSHQYMGQVVPDYDYFTDIWHCRDGIIKKLKSIHTEDAPQSGEDEAIQFFFEQVKCDLDEDPDCDLENNPWILTPSNLKKIIEYEEKIKGNERWKDACWIPLDEYEYGDCGGAEGSVASILADLLGGDFDKMTTSDIKSYVKLFMTAESELSALFDPLILEGFELNHSDQMIARRYRATFKTSLPFPTSITYPADVDVNASNGTGSTQSGSIEKSSKFKHFWDRPWKQRFEYLYDPWLWDLYKEMDHKPKGNLIDGNLRINSYPQMLWADYFTTYLLHKMIACMAIASCVTLIYATYDIGSLFLSLAALWEVLLTLPITLYIYHQMLGIEQFSPMQLSVVYILFAVGVYYYPAYVFVDHWLHTKMVVEDASDFKTRMSIAWRQAAGGAGVAQSTTFVSFASATTGTILMFKGFGVFAAVAIGVNYVLGIILFPCSILIWERYVRDWEISLGDCLRNNGGGILAFAVEEEYYKRFKTAEAVSFNPHLDDGNWRQKAMQNLERGVVDIGYGEQTIKELQQRYRRSGVFIGVHWLTHLHTLWVKLLVCLVTGGWVIATMYGVTTIKRIEENENFMGKDSFIMKSMHGMNPYTTNDQMRDQIHIMFGVNGMTPKSRDVWAEHFGEPHYNNLEVHTAAQQEALINFCGILKNFTSDANGDALVKSDEHVICIMEDFKDYMESMDNKSFPFVFSQEDSVQKHEYLKALHEFYHDSDAGIYWRNDYKMDLSLKGEHEYMLKSIEVEVLSIYNFYTTQKKAERQMDSWMELLSKWKEQCHDALEDEHGNLCDLRITSMRMTWNEGYAGYESSAKGSVMLTLPLIFIILCIVLNNWIMALLCVFNVLCIMISVLGIIGFIGWRFGLVECAAVILVLGFSVDYCVHISHGYLNAPMKDSRQNRVQFALLQNGHAIVSSAFVSFLASMPILVDGENLIYQKLGMLTVLTIASSVAFCFTSFTLILSSIAPQGSTGKLFCCNSKKQREGSQQALVV